MAEHSREHASACGVGYSAAMSTATSAAPLYSPRQPTGHYTQGHHPSLLPRIGDGVRAKGTFYS